MIYNGEIPTVAAAIYTVPSPTPGIPRSGSNATIDFFRIVNESGTQRTFTIWLVIDGNPRAITPVGTILPAGAAYDDIPAFQMPPASYIASAADGASVSWTINSIVGG